MSPTAAAGMSAESQQLEALIIPPTGGQIAYAQCPFAPADVPAIESIREPRLPQFRADRDRESNWRNGDQWRDDVELHANMAPMQAEIQRCLDLAACYVEGDALVGEVSMALEVTPEGVVRAATVDVTEQLAVEPVVPCARAALAQLRFPRIDGGNTFVSYALTIE